MRRLAAIVLFVLFTVLGMTGQSVSVPSLPVGDLGVDVKPQLQQANVVEDLVDLLIDILDAMDDEEDEDPPPPDP